MTYSRPGIGRVNVGPGGSGGNNPVVSVASAVRRTPDATYRDRRSPSQAAENVKTQYQGINALLEFATSEGVQNFVAQEIDRQAKREAGAVLDSYPGVATTSQNNPQADAAYNALSPRAKDFVVQARAANAVSTYGPALEAQLAKETILTAAGSTPEQRADAMSRATAAARDVSGLSALPPYQLTVNADKLAQIDGRFKGQAYQARVIREADLAQVGLIQGAASELSQGWKGLEQVAADDKAGDQPLTTGWRSVMQGVVDESANNFGPQGQAKILAGGIGEALQRITDPQEKLEFLERTLAESRTPMFGADGKTDIFSIPLGDTGKSITDVLEGLVPGAEDEADKAILGRAFLEMEQLRAKKDVEGARQVGLNALELLNDPTKIPGFIRDIESLTQRVTPDMKVAGNEMFQRELDGESAKALVKEMIKAPVGTYDPRDIDKMFSLAYAERRGEGTNNPAKQSNAEFYTNKSRQSNSFDVAFADYLKWTEEGVEGSVKQGELTPAGQRHKAALEREARQRFQELREEGLAEGNWDPAVGFEQALKDAVAAKKEKAPDADGKPTSAKDSYVSWAGSSLNTLAETAAANGGRIPNEKLPSSAIVPAVLADWQQQNPGKSYESLTGREKLNLLAKSIMTFERFDAATQQYVNYTEKEAKERAVKMLEEAERKSAEVPAPVQERVPETVPETPEELKQARRPGARGYGAGPIKDAVDLLGKAAQWATTKQDDPFNFNKIFNNNGFGPQAMSYVDGFLNLALGAAPANAGQLDFGTPEGLEALRTSWASGQQGLDTGPLPQVSAATPVRYAPVAITNDKHELFVMVGVAEGTRTASGGYTKAYYGHPDPGDGNWNRGTVSGGRGTNQSPQMVDREWMGRLTNVQQRMRGPLIVHGLQPGTAGYNRVMFNLIDLTVQSPAAARDFAGKLIQMKNAGWTVEAIAKARADSYISPTTGRLDAPGFGNNYQRLFKDQRSRAGVYDYRRRI